MQNSPSFSICVPVYNTERYLRKCLDSLLNQTYRNFEIIIVDDGSTDRSPEICDEYRRKFPEFVRVVHQKNGGLLAARRTAFRHAEKDFCLCCDSDDWLVPDALEILTKKNSRCNADIVLFWYNRCAEDSDSIVSKRKILPFTDGTVFAGQVGKKPLYELLADCNELNMLCMKAVRRTLIQADPLDYSSYDRLNVCEDLLQSLYPMTHADKILYIEDPLYVYRSNGGSLTRRITLDNLLSKNTLPVFEALISCLPQWGIEFDTDSKRRIIEARWFNETCQLQYLIWCSYRKTAAGRECYFLFPWERLVPEAFFLHQEENPYVRRQDKEWWQAVKSHDVSKMKRLYFYRQINTWKCYFAAAIKKINHPVELFHAVKNAIRKA